MHWPTALILHRVFVCVWLVLVGVLPASSWALGLSGSGGGVLRAQDEGGAEAPFRQVNCTGDGVTCSVVDGVLTLGISGVDTESGIEDPGGNGLVNRTSLGVTEPYAGTSCTNQVLRVLSAAGAGTCVTVTSAYVDSSIALTGGHLGQFAATTSAQMAGVLSDEVGASGGFTRAGAKLDVFAATSSAELATVLSDEEGGSGGFVRAGGNVATATALAANGANCSAGEAPLGVDASGAVEGCFSVTSSMTWGAGLAESGGTVSVDLTESASLFDGTAESLACGAGNGGQVQIGPGSNLEYCGYEATPLLHIAGLPQGLSWGDTLGCASDENMGKLTVVSGVIQCSPDVSDASTAAWNDGGASSLVCGGGAQGQHQVMNNGRLEYCGGEDVSALYAGYLLPSPLTFNITAGTCTGDANGGKLTINGSNQVVCATDVLGEGGAGDGDLTAFGTCATGDCATTASPLSSYWMLAATAPSAPAAGQGLVYLDETAKNLCVVSDDSAVKCGVQMLSPVANQFVTGIDADGSVSTARPSSADLSDGSTLLKLDENQITTGKQVVPRVCQLGATSGSLTPNLDLCDIAYRHDVVGAVAVQDPTATGQNPRNMHPLTLSFRAASEQPITWTSAYAGNYTIALPDTLPAGQYVAFTFRYNTTSTKYELWGAHVPDVSVSSILFAGSTSGVITMAPQAAAGTYNFNLPTSAGSSGQPLLSGGGGATAMTFGTLGVAAGGTGLTSGTSGGILAFTASGTLASSGALTANMPVIGGGAGVAPTVGTKSGNTTAFVTTTGTQTQDDCVKIDANGNHIAAGAPCGSGSAGTGSVQLLPRGASLPTSTPALLDASENNARLLFDNTVSWCAFWEFSVPADYASTPVMKIQYSMTSVTSGTLAFDVSVMAVTPGDSADANTDSYDTANACDDGAVPGTAGYMEEISCALTNFDSGAARDLMRLRVCRDVATDNAAGVAEMLRGRLEYAR